jgi:hypothetical protein
MAAISIILPTISVVTSGTSLISDSIKEKSFNAFIINCSVVMILNEDELEDNKEALDKYKEKVVDYEFSYDPKPSESLEILQDKLTAFKSCLSGKVIPMPIYGIVISLMCFVVACHQAFCFLEITCKNISVNESK